MEKRLRRCRGRGSSCWRRESGRACGRSLPKVLHRVGGRPMLHAVLDAAERLCSGGRPSSSSARPRPRVEEALADRRVTVAVQDPPLGTGDAVRCAIEALDAASSSLEGDGPVLVLSGDVPLLRPETLAALLAKRRDDGLDLAFLSFRPPEAGAFGRVVRDARGRVRRIVEARNASARETKIGEVNAGVYCFRTGRSRSVAFELSKKNRAHRGVLPHGRRRVAGSPGGSVEAMRAGGLARGVGHQHAARSRGRRGDRAATRPSSARSTPARRFSTRRRRASDRRCAIAPDVVLHPFVCLEGETDLGEGCEVFPFTRIADSRLEPGSSRGSSQRRRGRGPRGPELTRGPIRASVPGTVLGEDVRVGNFVETKNAVIGARHEGARTCVPGRRGDRRGREHRSRRDHLQLRRREEAPHDDRRQAHSSEATPSWSLPSRSAPTPTSAPARRSRKTSHPEPSRSRGRRSRRSRAGLPAANPEKAAKVDVMSSPPILGRPSPVSRLLSSEGLF